MLCKSLDRCLAQAPEYEFIPDKMNHRSFQDKRDPMRSACHWVTDWCLQGTAGTVSGT